MKLLSSMMDIAVLRAADRLSRDKGLSVVIKERQAELLGLVVSTDTSRDGMEQIRQYLEEHSALTDFLDYVDMLASDYHTEATVNG